MGEHDASGARSSSRLEQRRAEYEAEFGEIEARHREEYQIARHGSVIGQVLCGVAIGLWWHPFIAFAAGIGLWGSAKEVRKKCDADAHRRQLYGVE